MSSHITWLLAIGGALVYAAKKLFEPVLGEAGARLARWVLPPDRPATYRFARGACRFAWLLAAPRSAARVGALAALAEIGELARLNTSEVDLSRTAISPVAIARSVCAEALRSRALWAPYGLLGVLQLVLCAVAALIPWVSTVMLVMAFDVCTGGGLLDQLSPPLSPRFRRALPVVPIAQVGSVIYGVMALPAGNNMVGLVLIGLGILPSTLLFIFWHAGTVAAAVEDRINAVGRRSAP